MIKTAQNVADRYQLSREEIDAFALRSPSTRCRRTRLRHAWPPRSIPLRSLAAGRHRVEVFEHDEIIRGETTAEQLAALPPQPNTTQMTAGNSSPLSDGASAVVLGLGGGRPVARPSPRWPGSWPRRTYALDPQFMGDCSAFRHDHRPPAGGTKHRRRSTCGRCTRPLRRRRLGSCGNCPNQFDGFVVPDDRLNPNGGAVAIGHPFGSSGTRYVLTLATELHVREVRYGILGVCVGSGQGVALVLENAASTCRRAASWSPAFGRTIDRRGQ